MDIQAFYAFVAATCFTLVGLWWNVISSKKEWRSDPRLKKLAFGVYLSFLIPGLMSMFAEIGVENTLIWRAAFVIAAALGIYYTNQISKATSGLVPGKFHQNRWGSSLIYGLMILVAILPIQEYFGLRPLMLEGVLTIGLLLIGHGLTWEFLVEKAE